MQTFEWTEEDEDEDDDQDDFDDDDDITESQTVVVDDLSELSMVVDMQPGDLAVVLPPDVSVVAESTANNIRAGGANGNSSTSANQGEKLFKSNERSDYSYIGLADFFQEKVKICSRSILIFRGLTCDFF